MTADRTAASASAAPVSASATSASAASRAELIADTALGLLAERGMRGLTHRAVDEAAGLPLGSTSNHARTRAALLKAAVRRLAQREAAVLTPDEMPRSAGAARNGADPVAEPADALSLALHRSLTAQRDLLIARYELALEATRRPELREFYDATGRGFREPLEAMMTALGSTEPRRHARSLVAWCEGLMFSCAAGADHDAVPDRATLRTGFAELLRGMLNE
ncbi:TetR/AcrR family transcriptional regulator [Streptomyces antimycoticus]|uniref:TetR/AcrR family transcriptional regulator n=2 Tax=Streptomyces TaxID=1883 RepID=A0ABD5JET7_9ACTN|nr:MULTISPECIES: TetR/AcrR family transcriptional regulator [Streptomyces]MEE4585719.1 TetR/AcrR family transcriptional regulator [Streptomyces sp. DSM 41602]WJE01237.1 TetR/AcrR family transcriptional regulator [Streptomyces antimycoticus]WTA79530.1 TetR/AcrR family transcriptional regulator [Streptomyces antimycoticus]WTB10287.1 TetR/AcrR family transcriptional regulator [Streptomyces antimycoticus]